MEHGYIVDSVAAKYQKSAGELGIQHLFLNDVLHLPFEDRGGNMGFEIFPITEAA